MGKRLTVLLVAFAITAGGTLAALVVARHGSLSGMFGHAPPAHARFDDPTLAAVRDGGAGSMTRPAADPSTAATEARGGAGTTRAARRRHAGHGATVPSAAGHAGAPPLSGQGNLLVVCKPSCRVFVDGRAQGRSPPLKAIALAVGSHQLRVVGPDGHARKRLVLVAPDRVNRVTMVFGDGRATRSFRQETGTESW